MPSGHCEVSSGSIDLDSSRPPAGSAELCPDYDVDAIAGGRDLSVAAHVVDKPERFLAHPSVLLTAFVQVDSAKRIGISEHKADTVRVEFLACYTSMLERGPRLGLVAG